MASSVDLQSTDLQLTSGIRTSIERPELTLGENCNDKEKNRISKRRSRENTVAEKRLMHKKRRKTKRSQGALKGKAKLLKKHLEIETSLRKQAESSLCKYKNISRTYWERWRWELHKRKEALSEEILSKSRYLQTNQNSNVLLAEINPEMLYNPVIDGTVKEVYLARGCFGIVCLKLYRGIQVAVKRFLPRSLISDVKNEAMILGSLCHPYLPLLFGVCIKSQPYRIVMQYHGLKDHEVSTFQKELHLNNFSASVWLMLCSQLTEAVDYLHAEANILHNDIKGDNVLITQSSSQAEDCKFQVVLVDFGKATKVVDAKRYKLTAFEKREYFQKYPHIAPEVIEGETKQSIQSDIYSIGRLFYQIKDNEHLKSICSKSQLLFEDLAGKCTRSNFSKRLTSKKMLVDFKKIFKLAMEV